MIHQMNKYSTVDTGFSDRFLNSLHADDLRTGANDVDEAFDYFCKCKDRLELDIFNLRKFISNSAEVEQMVNNNYGMLTEEHNCLIENKILGLKWDKCEDNFVFDFNEIREGFDIIPTRRNVIKAIASLYDPLGLLNPIVVQMKTFFQMLCSGKYDWDNLITNDYLEEWNELVKSLSTIEFISVPRLYCYHNTNDPVVTIELHGFCDASMKACMCCVYLRFIHRSKFVKVVLVTSKSRIAPLRKQSIPKLELLSCLLLVCRDSFYNNIPYFSSERSN